MKNKDQNFNLLISGVGGQGLITLLQIISEAALLQGYDVKTSELHGLAQRGGSLRAHIRFGKKVYSPIIAPGKADLVLALESQESLAAAYFASKDSVFLINQYQTPTLGKSISEKQLLKNLEKVSKKIFLIPAAEICKKELGTSIVAGVYLLALASFKGMLSLKPGSIQKALKKTLAKKYLELNLKTFELAYLNANTKMPIQKK